MKTLLFFRHSLVNLGACLAVMCVLTPIDAMAELIVSNVRAAQRLATDEWNAKLVDIYYDLTDNGVGAAPDVTVSVRISNDDGISFNVPVSRLGLGGNFGAGQKAGKDRIITWDAGVDFNNEVSPNMRFEVKASPSAPIVPIYDMVAIPGGTFEMGDSTGIGGSDETVHSVQLSEYYIGKYEVSNALWNAVASWGASHGYADLNSAPSLKPDNHPISSKHWYDCVKWCNAYSEMRGRAPCYNLNTWECDFTKNGYRLPTEAEWEKAARGGLDSKIFPWGDTISHTQANYLSFYNEQAMQKLYSYDVSPTDGYHPIWSNIENVIESYTSPVGSFSANGYGLYDMAGNVSEWCWDWYDTYPTIPVSDPKGGLSGIDRVSRGGGWADLADFARVAMRQRSSPGSAFGPYGLRLVLNSDPETASNTDKREKIAK